MRAAFLGACVIGSSLLVACPDRPIGSPRCGDELAQESEECDGADFRGATCESLGHDSGNLVCKANCTIDTSACVPVGYCGDGVAQAQEECDGTDFKGETCVTRGWDGYELLCSADCHFDTHLCCLSGGCGDAVINCVEECDFDEQNNVPVLGGVTCQDLGFDGGTLNCHWCAFWTVDCCNDGPCGDGEINCLEDCETSAGATNLQGETCESLGFSGGTLGCSACAFDTIGCF